MPASRTLPFPTDLDASQDDDRGKEEEEGGDRSLTSPSAIELPDKPPTSAPSEETLASFRRVRPLSAPSSSRGSPPAEEDEGKGNAAAATTPDDDGEGHRKQEQRRRPVLVEQFSSSSSSASSSTTSRGGGGGAGAVGAMGATGGSNGFGGGILGPTPRTFSSLRSSSSMHSGYGWFEIDEHPGSLGDIEGRDEGGGQETHLSVLERYVRACVCTCMLVRMMPRRM